MNKFDEIALAQVSGSPVIQDREKLSCDSVIVQYPDGVTVTEFDLLKGDKGPYPVMAFKEDPSKFFCGGAVLCLIAEAWANTFGGDVKAASEALKESGGSKLRLYKKRNSKGQPLTAVEVVNNK